MSNSDLKSSTSESSAASNAAASGSEMAPAGDYYAILGIDKDASATDVKRAYGQLAWTWHPLKNLAFRSDAESMFRKIAEAYAILSDSVSRRLYDANVTDGTPFSTQHLHFTDPYEIFDDFKSFEGMDLGDDQPYDVDISSASSNSDIEDVMSIASNSSSEKVVTFSLTATIFNDDADKPKAAESTSPKEFAKSIASSVAKVCSLDGGNKCSDVQGGSDESVNTKTVNLTTETKDGRTYMTKQVLENGVETLNVVREGDITDDDIAEAEKFVDSL